MAIEDNNKEEKNSIQRKISNEVIWKGWRFINRSLGGLIHPLSLDWPPKNGEEKRLNQQTFK